MRLIGGPELQMLTRGADPELRGAALALAAELRAASWRSPGEARQAFPRAECTDDRLTVFLDDRHCAVVLISYEKGVALIEFAGPSAGRPATGAAGKA